VPGALLAGAVAEATARAGVELAGAAWRAAVAGAAVQSEPPERRRTGKVAPAEEVSGQSAGGASNAIPPRAPVSETHHFHSWSMCHRQSCEGIRPLLVGVVTIFLVALVAATWPGDRYPPD